MKQTPRMNRSREAERKPRGCLSNWQMNVGGCSQHQTQIHTASTWQENTKFINNESDVSLPFLLNCCMVNRQSCYKDQTPNSLLKAFLHGFSCSGMPCNERHWLLFLWTVFKDIFVAGSLRKHSFHF